MKTALLSSAGRIDGHFIHTRSAFFTANFINLHFLTQFLV